MKTFFIKLWLQIKVILFTWTAEGFRKAANKLDELKNSRYKGI